MPSSYIFVVGPVLLLLLSWMLREWRKRGSVFNRIQVRRRNKTSISSSSKHPSPSSSGFKAPALACPAVDLKRTWPPFQRERYESAGILKPKGRQFRQAVFEETQLGFEADYANASGTEYLPSGLSVDEIKELGDFPNYAFLSEFPMPEPYLDFDINKGLPRPYRPFRWAYHQTMALSKLEPDWWIELESTYKAGIAERKELYAKHGKDILQWLPGSELACKEVMEMTLQFLCARYPQYFSLSDDDQRLENKILGTVSVIKDHHPLLILLDNVPEDFVIMSRNPETGLYHFRAGVICSGQGFNVDTAIGKRLHEIHVSVPDYKNKMQMSMDRFFAKMPTSKPIQRGAWTLQANKTLYVAPGNGKQGHAHLGHENTEHTTSPCHLRIDWQTLRRLPLSGAVAFNFKTFFTPLETVKHEPYVPSLMLKVLQAGKEEILKYKQTRELDQVAIPMLQEFERWQMENGLMEQNWEPATLAESPFFPGWKAKWLAEQRA